MAPQIVFLNRCNFDQSQRVTWIGLAVSLSLHKDACIAVWLDVDIGEDRTRFVLLFPPVCRQNLFSVSSATVEPAPSDRRLYAAAVNKRSTLRRADTSSWYLRISPHPPTPTPVTGAGVCQGRVQSRTGHPTLGPGPASAGIIKRVARDLRPPHRREGFHAVLRCKGDQQSLSDAVALLSCIPGSGHDHGNVSAPRPEVARASSAPATREGHTAGWDGGVERVGTAWGQPAAAVGAGVLPTHHAWESFPGDDGLATATGVGVSGAGAGRGFPVGAACSPGAALGFSMPRREDGNGAALAWGAAEYQQAELEGFGGSTVRMRGAADAVSSAGTHKAEFYPPLPGGNNGSKARRFNGRIGKEAPPPPLPRGYRSSSLSSIARLTPQRQAESAAATVRKHPPKTKTRLITPAEISAIFSDLQLQVPPRVLAPQDVAVAVPLRSRPSPATRAKRGDREDPRAGSLPLGPSSLEEWSSRAPLCAHDGGDPRALRGPVVPPASAELVGGGGSDQARDCGGGCGVSLASKESEEDLGLSDGEAFFVLEDMFGGLLLPESLEKVFRESGNNLEEVNELIHFERPPPPHTSNFCSCFEVRPRFDSTQGWMFLFAFVSAGRQPKPLTLHRTLAALPRMGAPVLFSSFSP